MYIWQRLSSKFLSLVKSIKPSICNRVLVIKKAVTQRASRGTVVLHQIHLICALVI